MIFMFPHVDKNTIFILLYQVVSK